MSRARCICTTYPPSPALPGGYRRQDDACPVHRPIRVRLTGEDSEQLAVQRAITPQAKPVTVTIRNAQHETATIRRAVTMAKKRGTFVVVLRRSIFN